MPTLATFDHAMIRPGRNLPVWRQLGGGSLAMHGDNQPVRVVGSDAVVYRLENGAPGQLALRCFLSNDLPSSVLARYQRLSKDATLRRLRSVPHSPLVAFIRLFPEGILLPGPDFRSVSEPIVAMEWVTGPTLIEAVDRACRENEQRVLSALANSWLRAMAASRQVEFSHGALSSHNVMIDLERGPVLVDYDTAWWPGAVSVSKEVPPPAYAHPRGISAAPERRDDFAALVIYISLRALAVQPQLRLTFGDPVGHMDGGLLFKPADFSDPGKSDLFKQLKQLGDDEFQALIGILREACRSSVDASPPVDDAWRAARAVADRSREVAALPDLAELVPADRRNPQATWFGVASPSADEVRVDLFIQAVVDREAEVVADLWPEVRNSPAVSAYAIAATNLVQEFFEQRIRRAIDAEDDAAIVQAVKQAERLVIAVEPVVRRRYRQALKNTRTKSKLADALSNDDRVALADLAMTGDIDELHGLPRSANVAIRRAVKWKQFARAIELDSDQEILARASDELLTDPGYLPPEWVERISLANLRKSWLESYRRALKRRDGSAIAELQAHAPIGIETKLGPSEKRRGHRLVIQRRATLRLRQAIDSGSDRALVDAMNEIESSGALLPPDLDWLSVQGLVDRLSILASIRRAARLNPPVYLRLGRLLPAAREIFGSATPYLGSQLDFVSLELDVRRAAHRERLREAIRARDEIAILTAASPDPYEAIPTLSPREQEVVAEILQRKHRHDPLKGLETGPAVNA